MKKTFTILAMIFLSILMIPSLFAGFLWYWIKESFESGEDKAEKLSNYVDKL